jgi:hypothetical protein
MKIVLDINIFNNKKFCEWLLKSPEKKYLPAFAYLEYLYHNLKKGNTESMVDMFSEQMNVSVIPFRKEDALVVALGAIGRWDFKDNTRDYFIGATAGKLNGVLIINNRKDFNWLKNVIMPDELLKKIVFFKSPE